MKKLNITFCSFPDYSGNAKVLFEYMIKEYGDLFNYNWVFNDQKNYSKLNYDKANKITIGTQKYFNEIKKTNVFFTTHCNITGEKPENALYIELWHGISPKKVGFMINNISNEDKIWYEHLSSSIDYVIVPSEFWQPIFASRFYLKINQILPIGYPKLDLLKNKNAKENLSLILGENVEKYSKILLYTPTFRNGCGRNDDSTFGNNILNLKKYNENELIEYLEKNNYLLCIKRHPSEKGNYLESFTNHSRIKVIDYMLDEKNLDIYDVLDASDILLTDYSSLGIEYLFLDKPIIYLDTDVKIYNKNRGILFSNFDFWSCNSNVHCISDLIKLINKYLKENYVNPNFVNQRKLFFSELENGGTKNICEFFFTNDGMLKDIPIIENSSRKNKLYERDIDCMNLQIESLERNIEEKEKEIYNITNSKGWKLLERLRKIFRRY